MAPEYEYSSYSGGVPSWLNGDSELENLPSSTNYLVTTTTDDFNLNIYIVRKIIIYSEHTQEILSQYMSWVRNTPGGRDVEPGRVPPPQRSTL